MLTEGTLASTIVIPRSGSCRETDHNYDPMIVRLGKRFDVLLDGAPVARVIAYDCEGGWVRTMKANGRGVCLENGRAAERTLRGEVTVAWR